MSSTTSVLLAAAIAFGTMLVVVPLVRRVASRAGQYEHPVEDRWHRRSVPKLGGLAMAAAFLPLAWAFTSAFPFGASIAAVTDSAREDIRALALSSGLLFAVGLYDDVRPMRALNKLAWQSAAAAAFIWLTGPANVTGIPALDVLLSLLWFVGITNAFNLLDNIDGLAAGVAGIAASFVVAAMLLDGRASHVPLALTMSALAGTAFGFLVYNWHPASIFMGDGGSYLLGGVMAGGTLLTATHLENSTTPGSAIAIVLLLVPCADTLLVTLTRPLAGRSAFRGGRDHLSHRIVALGMPDVKAVLVLYAIAIAGGLVALGLQTLPVMLAWAMVAGYSVLVATVGVYLGHVETTAGASTPLPRELAMRYRIYELLFDASLVALAYYLGLVTRFHTTPEFSVFLEYLARSLPLVVTLHLVGLWLVGCYRRPVTTSAGTEILMILKGAALGSGASVVAVLYLTGFQGYSRRAFAVAAILVLLLLAGGHAVLNALDEFLKRRRLAGPRALIYGAGPRGALAARELVSNPAFGLVPFGFIDDSEAARAEERPEGLRVHGTLDDLDGLLEQQAGAITTIIVSIDALPPDRLERLCAIASRHAVEVRQLRLWLDEIETHRRRSAVVKHFR